MVLLTLCPIIFALVMFKNRTNLDEVRIQKKIGSMYLGIWVSEKISYYALSYSIVFLLRRSVFILISFLLLDYPGIQIQLFIYTSVLYIIYLNG